jgi:hypothetical protein
MSDNVFTLQNLLIPRPIKLGYRRGLASLNSSGRAVAVRMHEDDLALLDQEATMLGLSRGELMRWLCVYGAAALHHTRTGKKVEVTP